jgi:prepilin-type N-terminal cleavage/methylation domain-containing protein
MCVQKKQKNNFQRAFTLIELLVVISIIAILMAIMMPALAKAREISKRTVCLSNIKQLALACATYADNGGFMPYNYVTGAKSGMGATRGFHNYIIKYGATGGNTEWINYGLLFEQGYIKTPKVFYCPSQKGDVRYQCDTYFDGDAERDESDRVQRLQGAVGIDGNNARYIRGSYLARNYNPLGVSYVRGTAQLTPKATKFPFGSKYAFLADRWTYESAGVHEEKYYNIAYCDGSAFTLRDNNKYIKELGTGRIPDNLKPEMFTDWADAWKIFDAGSVEPFEK